MAIRLPRKGQRIVHRDGSTSIVDYVVSGPHKLIHKNGVMFKCQHFIVLDDIGEILIIMHSIIQGQWFVPGYARKSVYRLV